MGAHGAGRPALDCAGPGWGPEGGSIGLARQSAARGVLLAELIKGDGDEQTGQSWRNPRLACCNVDILAYSRSLGEDWNELTLRERSTQDCLRWQLCGGRAPPRSVLSRNAQLHAAWQLWCKSSGSIRSVPPCASDLTFTVRFPPSFSGVRPGRAPSFESAPARSTTATLEPDQTAEPARTALQSVLHARQAGRQPGSSHCRRAEAGHRPGARARAERTGVASGWRRPRESPRPAPSRVRTEARDEAAGPRRRGRPSGRRLARRASAIPSLATVDFRRMVSVS